MYIKSLETEGVWKNWAWVTGHKYCNPIVRKKWQTKKKMRSWAAQAATSNGQIKDAFFWQFVRVSQNIF